MPNSEETLQERTTPAKNDVTTYDMRTSANTKNTPSDNSTAATAQRQQQQQPPAWPDDTASCWSNWTYGYMMHVLRKGASSERTNEDTDTDTDGSQNRHHHLTSNDIYAVPTSMEAKKLTADFMHQMQTQKQTNPQKKQHKDDEEDSSRRIFRILWHVGAPFFRPAAACEFVRTLALVVQPLLTRELLLTLEDHPGDTVRNEPGGYPPVVASFLVLLVYALTNHRQQDFAMKGGVAIRAAVSSALYQHSLTLTPRGRSGVTTGEVTNLIATDAQKLYEVAQVMHLLWSCPMAIALVTSFLLWIMGPISLIGVLVLVSFAPAMEAIVGKMVHARKQRARLTDERIEITSAMLQGIMVTKLGNYEDRFLGRINDARSREMKYVRRELLLWGTTLFMTVLSSVLAAAATFIAYALIYEDRVLDAATTFTVLNLFAALRFPINYFGTLMGKGSQAYGAARRISVFLDREAASSMMEPKQEKKRQHWSESSSATTDENPNNPGDDDAAVLIVENGTFTVGNNSMENASAAPKEKAETVCVENSGFTLSNIDFSLHRTELLAVVGPVGAGKSTLVQALIGEIAPHSSSASRVTSRGKIAYAAQCPFILNATVRENILFGEAYDRERYETVLDDCCLRPDLKQIGPAAGDMTQIGERGVTLSGGTYVHISQHGCTDVDGLFVYSMLFVPLCKLALKPLEFMFGNSARVTILSDCHILSPAHFMLHSFCTFVHLQVKSNVFPSHGWPTPTQTLPFWMTLYPLWMRRRAGQFLTACLKRLDFYPGRRLSW